jgi:Fe-S cluster assembly ATP-binding protein
MFSIKNLTVGIDTHTILNDVSFECAPGSVHALMGANGSGKSTFVHVLAGNPLYTVQNGSVEYNGVSLLALAPEERVRHGLFVVFQNLPAIPGLTVLTFLADCYRAITGAPIDAVTLEHKAREYSEFLGMSTALLYRNLYEGFSGGEKKRFELLQILLFKPRVVILDEIDSGLDVDALKMVALVIQRLKDENAQTIIICITHYQKLLDYLCPDHVHVLSQGKIILSGDHTVGTLIEQHGYQHYV